MRSLFLVVLLGAAVGWAQSSPNSTGSTPPTNVPSSPSETQAPASNSNSPSNSGNSSGTPTNPQPAAAPANKPYNPILNAPRSDTVNAGALQEGESSSKDDQLDLSPPASDLKAHPDTPDMLKDEGSTGSSAVHPWDPHKAAKDIEVGDFYFKRKNYIAAADRYREALFYKDNDAVATFRLAESLEKLEQPAEAQKEYENYLKILPEGPEAAKAHKALNRLNPPTASDKSGK
jgi:tetratricopeptide (TPR) repeat protein